MVFGTLVWPVVAALMGMVNYLHQDAPKYDLSSLKPINAVQEEILHDYQLIAAELEHFKQDELFTVVTHDIDEANAVLEKNGYSIRLQPTGRDDDIASVSIMNVNVAWQEPASETTITRCEDNKEYAAFKLTQGFEVYYMQDCDDPIVAISTRSADDTVWAVRETVPGSRAELLKRAALLRATDGLATGELKKARYTNLIMPMIDYEKTQELKELIGLNCGKGYQVVQALQQTMFKMNHLGASAESAAALLVAKCFPTELIMDGSFHVALMRKGLSEPVFNAHMDTQYWKNPGDFNVN